MKIVKMATSYEKQVATLKASANSQKGHVTRIINFADNLCTQAANKPSSSMAAKLQEQLEKLEAKFEDTSLAFTELVGLDPDNAADYDSEVDTCSNKYMACSQKILDALADINKPPAPPAVSAPITPAQTFFKPNDSLRPFKLTVEHNPVEFRMWLKQFKAFYTTSGLKDRPIVEQQAYIQACLDPKLDQRIQDSIDMDTPIFEENSYVSFLEQDLLVRYPLFTRRLEFFKCTQAKNQSFTEFSAALRSKGNEADLHKLTTDDLFVFRYICGTTDQDLKTRFLRLKDPDKGGLESEARAYESASSCQKAMSGEVNRVQQDQRGRPRNKQSGKGNRSQSQHNSGKCFRCGLTSHKTADCNKRKEDLFCQHCKIVGHLQSVCINKKEGRPPGNTKRGASSSRNNARSTNDNSTASVTVQARHVSSQPTPKIDVKIQAKGCAPFKHPSLPDTGTTRTLIPYNVATMHHMPIDPNGKESLTAANGEPMECEGSVQTTFTYMGKKAKINALVSSSLKELLISWHDLIPLGVLPASFPNQAQQVKATGVALTLEKIQAEFKDILGDSSKLKEGGMAGPPMRIKLREDQPITPKRTLVAHKVPLHYQEQADKEIQTLLARGIIERVDEPTEWISPAFFVPKTDAKGKKTYDKLRLVTNFSHLNQFVERPVHNFPSSQDIVNNIEGGSKFFAKLDAVQGYHQIPLDEPSSNLTTFLLPSGRYRYKRAPMGLNASSDEWCRRSDEVIRGMKGVLKIVDDIIVFAPTKEELYKRLRSVLANCRKHNITMSNDKLEIGEEVKIAGFCISSQGVKPDPKKVEAIAEFPKPTDLTSLRSFLGLVNQFGTFAPDIAHMTESLRSLLRKDIAFTWLADHDEAFLKIKEILTSPALVSFFQKDKRTELLTDASRLKGLGYALIQKDTDNNIHLIQCGSRSLTKTESNYSTTELECLAITWAIAKCRHFLSGHPGFKVITDHRPLVGTFKKALEDFTNARLQRFVEKLSDYTFTVEWMEGKAHQIADALSRAPVFSPPEEAETEESVNWINIARAVSDDPQLSELIKHSQEDAEYQEVIQALKAGSTPRELPPTHPAKLYSSVWNQLSIMEDTLLVYEDTRIVVPKAGRQAILQLLHQPHSGIAKTRMAAQQLYYWPNISNEIKQMVNTCEACQRNLPSQPAEPLQMSSSSRAFAQVGTDLFEKGGQHYLVLVDRFSGFPLVHRLTALKTSTVTDRLLHWFQDWGFPQRLRSDGGPQFRGPFEDFCAKHNIVHELTSPRHSQSNGLAEAAVANVKGLLEKTGGKLNAEFRQALFEWRNSPRTDGYSPAQMVFGRRQRSSLPTLPNALEPIDKQDAAQRREQTRNKSQARQEASRELPPLKVGQKVRVQNHNSNQWNLIGQVIKQREHGRSYAIHMEGGKTYIRNRCLIRPFHNATKSVKINESANTILII